MTDKANTTVNKKNKRLKVKKQRAPSNVEILPGGTVLTVNDSKSGLKSTLFDTFIRFAIALIGVYGVCSLLLDALRIDAGVFDILLPCFMFTASFFALFTSFKVSVFGIIGLAGGVGIMTAVSGVSISELFKGGVSYITARINAIMDSLGYVAPAPSYNGHETVEGVLTFGALTASFVFVICIRKRAIGFIVTAASAAMMIPLYFYGMVKTADSAFLIVCSICGYYAIGISERHGGDRKQSSYSGLLAVVLALAILISPIGSLNKAWPVDMRFISLQQYASQIIEDISNGKMPDLGWGTSIPDPSEKRTSKPSSRFHIGARIMDVYSSFTDTVYLRTWTGGEYSDDSWYPVIWSEETKKFPDIAGFMDTVSYVSTNPMISDLMTAYSLAGLGDALYELTGLHDRTTTIVANEKSGVFAVPPLFTNVNKTFSATVYDGIVLDSNKNTSEYRVKGLYLSSVLYGKEKLKLFDKYVEGYVGYMNYRGFVPEKLNEYGKLLLDEFGSYGLNDISNRFAVTETAVKLVYGRDYEDAFIDAVVLELFNNGSGITEYFEESNYSFVAPSQVPDEGYVVGNGVILRKIGGNVYSYVLKEPLAPSAVMEIAGMIADYLDQNCKYDLSPKTTANTTAMQDFLFGSREGYCVQFATAGTLILRRLGIESRYAEGYVATDFVRNYSYDHGHGYKTTVRDENAHAWTEIWISGIGWVPYEMTPSFDGLLEGETSEITTEITTDTTFEDTTEPNDTTDDVPDTDVTTDNTTDDPITSPVTTTDTVKGDGGEGGISAKTVITAVIIAFAVGAVGFAVYYVVSENKKAKERRIKLYKSAMNCENMNQAERKRIGAVLTQELASVLAAYRISVNDGEQPSQFGKRLDSEMSAMGLECLPSSFIDAMSSQIYAGVMTADEIKTACASLIELRGKAKKEIGLLRYVAYKMKRIL